MIKRHRQQHRWEESAGDDPAAGLLNLFDLWMVFAVSLLLAVATMSGTSMQAAAGSEASAMEPIPAAAKNRLQERLIPTDNQLAGEGQRLGTAYRLNTGEVVYVPDPAPVPR